MSRRSHRQLKLRSLEKRYTLWMKFRLALHRNTPRAIQHHKVFQNQSHCPQRPVALQLMVTLYHFYDQAGACAALQFGIGEGTIHLYVNRVIEAILSLQDQYIKWPMPGSDDYKQTTDMHQHQFGFPNCLGFGDGSNDSLFHKLSVDGSRYYNRNTRYALNVTVIVDGNAKILWLVAGSMSLIKSHC